MQNQNWQFMSKVVAVVAVTLLVVSVSTIAGAQKLPGNKDAAAAAPAGPHNWITPASSIERPADAGRRAHTNWVFGGTNGRVVEGQAQSQGLTTHYETPSSMGCLYKIPGNTGPCVPNINSPGGPQKGGWGAIAVVDAYDNPYAAGELQTFDAQFGLPAANFVQVYANGNGDCSTPPFDPGWGLEESLDIEWAHTMAPKATIVLVEACSNSFTDLLYAEYVAAGIVSSYGGGDVTNSWDSGEFSGENSYDAYFGYYYPFNTVYFASAGDSGCGASYPSSSPWIVSAGGTTVNRNAANLAFKSESCWAGSGGGTSSQEVYTSAFPYPTNGDMGPWANYQYGIFGQSNRSTPDMSFNADPNSGVVVYDCAYDDGTCFFYEVGGTSVSSPSLAGIVNNAANKLGVGHINPATSSGYYTAEENNLLYSQLGGAAAYSKNFYDVSTGSNGCTVGKGWDYCTGVGSPRALLGK
ncbi:MAG TPA: S53 family peptidase [Terriglobales bacterium]|nr:S53 family peptidase [Terriglobales bacterium]